MRTIQKLFLIITSIFLFWGAINSNLNTKSYSTAIVTKVIHDVKHKSGEENWTPTKELTQLKSKDLLTTGKKSLAVIKYIDGSILRVRENSTIVIFADKKDRGLIKNTRLENGKIVFDVNNQLEDDKFLITTPTVVITVRGTSGLVEILENGATSLILNKGTVELESTGENRKTEIVQAGTTSIINPDGDIIISESTEEERRKFLNSTKTNQKSIDIRTNKGNFKIYYLDSE